MPLLNRVVGRHAYFWNGRLTATRITPRLAVWEEGMKSDASEEMRMDAARVAIWDEEGRTRLSFIARLKDSKNREAFEKAWEQLYKLHKPIAYHVCKRHELHRDDIEDVIHVVFM